MATKVKPVSIGKLLAEDLILVMSDAPDKNTVIERLATNLCSVRALGEPKFYLGKVLAREMGISTTLDTGLSLPHARVDGIKDFAAALGILPKGIVEPKQPDLIIRAMFLFLSPNVPQNKEIFNKHLQLLRAASGLFQSEFIDQLVQAPTPALVLQMIRKKEGE